MQQLQRSGVVVVQAPDLDGADEVVAKIVLVGNPDRDDAAQALAGRFQADLAAVQAKGVVHSFPQKPGRIIVVIGSNGAGKSNAVQTGQILPHCTPTVWQSMKT
ncbi:MAG: hypothetical protein OXC96_00280 [Cyanobacteria bacterium MAG CAR1_bin_15]|nr:hypothetical protein [Cyanobacteria bacterium MAG CAR1_bin_15]